MAFKNVNKCHTLNKICPSYFDRKDGREERERERERERKREREGWGSRVFNA